MPGTPSTSSSSSSKISTSDSTSPDATTEKPSRIERPDLERGNTTSALSKNVSNTSARISRVQSLRSRSLLTSTFTHPLANVKTGPDVLVDFEGEDDPYRPMNWPFRKKCITTALYGFTTMGATFASSVYSPTVDAIAKEYKVGTEVTLLGISLLLAGFGLGPLIWAPLSEVYGRKPAVLIPYFLAAIFTFATAVSKDIQTIMITRFFTGFFGSAPITNTGGVLGDIFPPRERGTALVMYAFAVVGGPTLGPIVGGAITQSYLGWRWTEYVTGMWMMFVLLLDVLILDESYAPRLLVYKARRLRVATGNWALHAQFEEWDVSIKELAVKFGVRPFQMLATPICFFVALYASFVYGILYANLASFPIEFEEERGWNQLVGALPFLALMIGIVIGGIANIYNTKFYIKRLVASGKKTVPEARLPPMMVGGFFFSAALFVLGWTSDKKISWVGPCFGAIMLGFGFFTIFQSALLYLIDTFTKFSASAIAVNTFLRSIFAFAFPLFINPMYHKLGIDWASSVFAFFALTLIPIPFVFYKYGPRIRAKGKYSANAG